jgi:hypothetical protein
VYVIEGFGGDHDAGDKQAMDVERSDKKVGLAMNEAVDEDIANDEARGTATGVLEDAL